jgi:hypothetical protein
MTPEELKQKMAARRETAQMVREYWAEMMPDFGGIPEPQLLGWINRFDLDTIVQGINAAMIIRSKQDAAGKETSVQAAVNYASGAMNKLKPADPEKAARISEARSKAGKAGRAKQLAEEAKAHGGFAQGHPDLPEVAQPLPPDNDYGFGVGSGSGFAFVPVSGSASVPAAAFAFEDERVPRSTSSASPTAANAVEKKKEQTNTNTNPAGAPSVLANQEQKQNQNPDTVLGWKIPDNICAWHREQMHSVENQENCSAALRGVVQATRSCAKCNPPKLKTLKTVRGEKPMPAGFNAWTSVERTQWIECTCGMADSVTPDIDPAMAKKCASIHRPECKSRISPQAQTMAAAAPKGLGNVDDL